jgi:hypothetical protein
MMAVKIVLFIFSLAMLIPVIWMVGLLILAFYFVGMGGVEDVAKFTQSMVIFAFFFVVALVVFFQMMRLVSGRKTLPVAVLAILWVVEISLFFIPVPLFENSSVALDNNVKHNFFDIILFRTIGKKTPDMIKSELYDRQLDQQLRDGVLRVSGNEMDYCSAGFDENTRYVLDKDKRNCIRTPARIFIPYYYMGEKPGVFYVCPVGQFMTEKMCRKITDAQQYCENKYGVNSVVGVAEIDYVKLVDPEILRREHAEYKPDGRSYCSCSSGYEFNADRTTCIQGQDF